MNVSIRVNTQQATMMIGRLVLVWASSLTMAMPDLATGGENHSSANAILLAQAHGARPFDIPAQPLEDAVTAFGLQSGLQITLDSQLASGVTSHPLQGTYTPQEGLRRMLEGTGLNYRMTGENTVMLERESAAVPVVVPPASQVTGDSAEAPAADTAKTKRIKVPEVVVKEVRRRETAELNSLPPEYPGGQVASGGRVGNLGNKNIMDTPFTQMNYTSKLIQNQQTRFLTDVLRNDPSVQLAQPTATGFTNFAIRGFRLSNDDILFNGFAITPAPNGSIMTESIERVEILRGPSALLNGASPSGSIGGMINLVPKYAGDEALTQITAQYLSDTQGGGHVDLGRRFGSHKQFGVRINGVYRNGNPSIDHASRESALASVGLDYRSDIVRLMADFGYQHKSGEGCAAHF